MQVTEHDPQHFRAHLQNETGVGEMDVYQVFPGIYLSYNDFHLRRCDTADFPAGGLSAVSHCRAGRIEQALETGDFAYLGAGCLVPRHSGSSSGQIEFPRSLYQGMTLGFDLSRTAGSLPDAFPVHPEQLCPRLCAAAAMDLTAHPRAGYVFGLIYSAQNLPMIHKKMACLELLLLLHDLPWSKNAARPLSFPRLQVARIKEMEAFLTAHLEHRYTLEELSALYDLPVNAIRRCFSGVFGDTVASYIRHRRMELAQQRLRSTDETIAEISASLGYDNPSKFAAAFRSCARISPQMYRGQFRVQERP